MTNKDKQIELLADKIEITAIELRKSKDSFMTSKYSTVDSLSPKEQEIYLEKVREIRDELNKMLDVFKTLF